MCEWRLNEQLTKHKIGSKRSRLSTICIIIFFLTVLILVLVLVVLLLTLDHPCILQLVEATKPRAASQNERWLAGLLSQHYGAGESFF